MGNKLTRTTLFCRSMPTHSFLIGVPGDLPMNTRPKIISSALVLLLLPTAAALMDMDLPPAQEPPARMVLKLDDIDPSHSMTHGAPPSFTDTGDIRPGSALLIQKQGGLFLCTAGFLFENVKTGQKYVGTAGHCVLTAGCDATHGAGTLCSTAGVSVAICIKPCYFGGSLATLNSYIPLGKVAYARQTDGHGFCPGDIGNDFALIEIPPQYPPSLVDPAVSFWHGPTAPNGNEGTGRTIGFYGNGIGLGETIVSKKPRPGVTINDGIFCSWQAALPVSGGDSGGPAVFVEPHGPPEILHGDEALGILTHGTIAPALAWGTSLGWAEWMAFTDAGLDVVLIPE